MLVTYPICLWDAHNFIKNVNNFGAGKTLKKNCYKYGTKRRELAREDGGKRF